MSIQVFRPAGKRVTTVRIAAVAVAFALLIPSKAARAQTTSATGGLVIRNVTVVDTNTGKRSPNMSVVVEGGKITKVASSRSIKAESSMQVVDGHGKYIVPGFWNMHSHALNPGDQTDQLNLMLANGITGFRQMSGSPELLKMRKDGKLILPPDSPEVLVMPGQILTFANAATPQAAVAEVQRQKQEGADFIKTINLSGPSFEAALLEANRQGLPYAGHLSGGVDAVKMSELGMRAIEHLGPTETLLVSCSTDEAALRKEFANAPNRTLGALAPDAAARLSRVLVTNPVLAAVLADPTFAPKLQRMIDTYSETKCRAVAAVFVAHDTWQAPTLIRLKAMELGDDPSFRNNPDLKYEPAETRQFWDSLGDKFATLPAATQETLKQLFALQLRVTKLFEQSGVKILAGDDGGAGWLVPGFCFHQEFELLAEGGLSPLRVLQSTTIDGAKFLGLQTANGTVEGGKNANLVLLDEDPIKSVSNLNKIYGVVRAGKFYSRADLDALLMRVEDRAAATPQHQPKPTTP